MIVSHLEDIVIVSHLEDIVTVTVEEEDTVQDAVVLAAIVEIVESGRPSVWRLRIPLPECPHHLQVFLLWFRIHQAFMVFLSIRRLISTHKPQSSTNNLLSKLYLLQGGRGRALPGLTMLHSTNSSRSSHSRRQR